MVSGEKVKNFFVRNIGYFIVALVSLIYIATAIITIDKTGKTLGQIVADSALVFFLGFFITRVFDLQGILSGEQDDRVIKAINVHGETVVKISPYIDRLDKWCRLKNEENLRIQRTRILATEGLKYVDYFNADGSSKKIVVDEERMKNKLLRKNEIKRIACFNKALRLKLTPLTAGELTSESSKTHDPYNFGRTKAQYEKQKATSDLISKIFIAIIFGYYAVKTIEHFNVATLIWNCFQVGIFLMIGVIGMIRSFLFIVDEWRGRVVKKTNHLEMFYDFMMKNPNFDQETEEQEITNLEVSESESKQS